MADDIETKRRELDQMYDELQKLERADDNAELIKHYRARTRQVADEITDLERGGDA